MKIAVLVSGGVDSSVALRLLKDQGHDLTAFYLKIWLEDELSYLGDCPWEQDLAYVRDVCEQVGVPLEVVSLQQEYKDEVVAYTIEQVHAGRTPNPDVLCNSRIKFGTFLKYLDASYDKVATGHYAQVKEVDGQYQLHAAPDPIKDQSYFLAHLNQDQLRRVMFPIGHLQKDQVRAFAQEFDLPTKDRKDSQGICFLGKLQFRDFIKHYLGEKPGDLVEYETGNVLAQHAGFWFYTVGQRKGILLSHGPWYVVDKDPERNIVFISKNYFSPEKKRDAFSVSECNWIGDSLLDGNANIEVKVRHGAHRHTCTITPHEKGFDVQLDERDQGIASGQFAALYDGTRCLGSGIIT